MSVVHIRRRVDAPAPLVWDVVSDLEGYADVAPNLSGAEVLEGRGVGLRRRCYDRRGRGWTETCTLWEEGRRYAFAVDTAAPDYPYPIERLHGSWAVEPEAARTVIAMRFEYEPRGGALGRALGWALAPLIWLTGRRLLKRWEARIAARCGAAPGQAAASRRP